MGLHINMQNDDDKQRHLQIRGWLQQLFGKQARSGQY